MTHSIGTARMQTDGTLVLHVTAHGAQGERGHATLTYAPGHPRYTSVLTHVGEIHPGEEKPVRPWP